MPEDSPQPVTASEAIQMTNDEPKKQEIQGQTFVNPTGSDASQQSQTGIATDRETKQVRHVATERNANPFKATSADTPKNTLTLSPVNISSSLPLR